MSACLSLIVLLAIPNVSSAYWCVSFAVSSISNFNQS